MEENYYQSPLFIQPEMNIFDYSSNERSTKSRNYGGQEFIYSTGNINRNQSYTSPNTRGFNMSYSTLEQPNNYIQARINHTKTPEFIRPNLFNYSQLSKTDSRNTTPYQNKNLSSILQDSNRLQSLVGEVVKQRNDETKRK